MFILYKTIICLSFLSSGLLHAMQHEKPAQQSHQELYERAEKLFQQERFEEAIPYLEKSAALGNNESYLMLGRIYIRLTHHESDGQRAGTFLKKTIAYLCWLPKREMLLPNYSSVIC